MKYYIAQDTFVGALDDGTEHLVTKGTPLPETHELVKRDLAAGKRKGRVPLFKVLDPGEAPAPEKPDPPEPPAPSEKDAKVTSKAASSG